MPKKSTKTNETEAVEPVLAETEVVAEPQAEAKPKAETKPKAKKAAKRARKVVDPIGDETDGEAKTALEAVAEPVPEAIPAPEAPIEPAEDTAEDALEAKDAFETAAAPDISSSDSDSPEDSDADSDEDEPESIKKPRPPAKLERLQKILAQAGVASRRKAEEMIEQGRVQVNGKVVTELGTKADAGRDHIRVDGKLLQGAERLRYFVLNKPKGFVTTVKDPEGRPTVMQFFDKMRERLYPVGRLDYMSEGLLLVTNDGELANRLTRAAAGVEKTYLVKVAGIPTEAELDILRGGVSIDRGAPGSAKIRTSPARIRQVRQGDNPWYEVVLIEGRNRELRKMFEEIGHFVEKIRRVGYGPLILDQEPGNLRELDAHELELLRKAADGTLRTPKSKDLRRRDAVDAGRLPTVAPRSAGPRPSRPFTGKSFEERPAAGPKDYRPKRSFDQSGGTDRPNRPAGSPSARPAWKKDDRSISPASRFAAGSASESRPPAGKPFGAKPYGAKPYTAKPFGAKPYERGPAVGRNFGAKPPTGRTYSPRPETGGSDRSEPPASRPHTERPSSTRPYAGKPTTGRSFPPKPAWKKPEGQQWPPYKRPPADRPAPPRRESPARDEDFGPVRPPNLHIEEIKGSERPSSDRPTPSRSAPSRPYSERPSSSRPRPDRPQFDRPSPPRSGPGRSSGGHSGPNPSSSGRSSTGRPSSSRPSFRSEGGLARPFTTSSGKPRPGGVRPSSKPGTRPYSGAPKRSFDAKPGGPSKRPFRREEGEASSAPRPPRSDSGPPQRTGGKPGWKPKPSFGGKSKPGTGGKSRPPFKSGPKPGGFSKSGYKGKPGGKKRG